MRMEKARDIVSEHGGIEVGNKFEIEKFGEVWVHEIVELKESGSGIRQVVSDIEVAGETIEGEIETITDWAGRFRDDELVRK